MSWTLELLPLAISLLLLTAVGLDLRLRDFAAVGERPGMVAAGVLLPPLLLPWVAIGLVRALEPSPAAARGLLLLTACPIGGIATTYSLLARANPALSVTLAAVSCVLAVVTMPIVLAMLAGRGVGLEAAPIGVLVQQLTVVLLPPVALGMAIRSIWPAWALRRQPQVQAVAFVLLVILLALVMRGATSAPQFGWGRALALVASFVVVAFALGGIVASLLGGSAADRFTFAAEFGTRNVSIGLAASIALGMAQEFAWLGAVYLMVEIPLMLAAAWLHRRRTARRPSSFPLAPLRP